MTDSSYLDRALVHLRAAEDTTTETDERADRDALIAIGYAIVAVCEVGVALVNAVRGLAKK